MLTQLNPMLPVEIIGRGKGLCFAIIDYSEEHNLIFVTAMDETGEIWAAPNASVRMQSNWSMGRVLKSPSDAAVAPDAATCDNGDKFWRT